MPARRRRPRTIAPAMMAGAALLLAAVPVRAQDAHGAIAAGHVTQDQAVAYGFAWDYPARDEAEEAALNACLSASAGADCTVLAWFQNSCGALAVDQYGMAQGKGARTLEQAEARALATCEAAGGSGCAVVGSQCVNPGGEPDTWSGSESVLKAPEEESGPTAAAPRDEELTREERMQVQQGLVALGFDAGPADGMFGPRTRSAIWEWQQAKGLETTGYLTRDEAGVLAAAGAEYREQPASRETAEVDGSRNQVLYFAAAGPKCAELRSTLGERESAACWQEIQGQPGCYIWREHYRSDSSITDWTGGCSGDTAHGRGSYSVSVGGEHRFTASGAVMHGKQNGHWVIRYTDGEVGEGPYVDGKRHGHWVDRWDDGSAEGAWLAGKRHGRWVFRYTDGRINEISYVNGKRHGRYVWHLPDGGVSEGSYVDGKRHGHWVTRDADGDVSEGPYVNGEMHGRWILRDADGTIREVDIE